MSHSNGQGTVGNLPKSQARVWIFSNHVLTSKGLPLTLNLTSTNKFIGALLNQEVEGVERPVYYLSRSLEVAKLNYMRVERHRLILIFATQKLHHYFLAHSLNLVTKSNPLTYLLLRLVLSERVLGGYLVE